MAKKGSFSKVYDKNGDYVDVEAARFDGTRTFQMQGDVSATQTWNGDSSSTLTLNTSIGAKKVTTDKINDKAVQAQQIDDGAVGLTQIATAAMNGTVQDNDSKLATHAAVKTYVDAQISGQGTYLGKHTVAEINAMVTDNLHNGDRVMTSDSGTINLGPGGVGFDVEAGEDLILYKSGSTVQWDSMDGNFKTKQSAVDDPTASGTGLTFIDSASQDENGEMTLSKKTVQDGTTSQKGVVQLEDSHSSTSTTKAATPNSVKEAYDLANTANTGAVKNVAYDSTNKKITKTINGTTSDVVSAATLKTDMALNNVDNTSDANKPVSTAQQAALDLKLDKTGDGKDVTVTFTEASTRANIGTGEKLSVIFGKIKKWFSDLKALAFKDKVGDGDIDGTITDTHISSASTWNGKYDKPNGGIPKSDLSAGVQASLDLADSSVQDVSGKADKASGLTGATKCKITYNSDGIVTAGANLTYSDIPIGNIYDNVYAIETNLTPWLCYEISDIGLTASYSSATAEIVVHTCRSQGEAKNMSYKVNIHWTRDGATIEVEGTDINEEWTAVVVNSETPATSDVTTLKIYCTPSSYTTYRLHLALCKRRGSTNITDGKITKKSTQEAIPTASSLVIIGTTTVNTLLNNNDVKSTYSSTGTDPLNGTAVASALSSYELLSNKVTSWSDTTTDTHYPSEKLVKDGLGMKVAINGNAVRRRANQDGDGWGKLASITSYLYLDNVISRFNVIYNSSKRYGYDGILELSIRRDNEAPQVGYFNFYTNNESKEYRDIAVAYSWDGNNSVTIEIWGWLSKGWHALSIVETSTGSYENFSHKQWTYTNVSGGGTSKPVNATNYWVVSPTYIKMATTSDIAKMVQVENAGTAAGSRLQPVYVNASGVATAGDFSTWNSQRGSGNTLNNMPVAWYRTSGSYSVTSGELTQYVEISGLDDFGYIDFWFNIFANNNPFTIHLRVNTYASGRKSIELLERVGYDSTFIESVSLRVTSSTDRRTTTVYLKVLRTNGSIMWRSTANISNSNFAVLTEQQYNALTTYKINELNITEIGTTARTGRHYQRNYAVLDTGDVKSTYSSTGTDPVNGTAVAAALATSLTDVSYAANASGGGGNLNKTKNGSTTSVLAFMATAEAHSLWTNAKANAS